MASAFPISSVEGVLDGVITTRSPLRKLKIIFLFPTVSMGRMLTSKVLSSIQQAFEHTLKSVRPRRIVAYR